MDSKLILATAKAEPHWGIGLSGPGPQTRPLGTARTKAPTPRPALRRPCSAETTIYADNYLRRPLSAQTQRGDDAQIPLNIRVFQIIQEPPTLADELEQAPPRMVVLLVGLKVLGQVRDPLTQKCNLNFRRSRVFFVQAMFVDDALLCADS